MFRISNDELFKRLGKIHISEEIIRDLPDTVQLMLHDVLIVEATCRYHMRAIEYIGYSEHFDVLDEGLEVPLYTVVVDADGIFDFKRV